MEGPTRTAILLILATIHSTYALEARKVLHIPEKIIGGVIDIVQNHKNKPVAGAVQSQSQTQAQQVYPYPQYAPWNTGYISQNQAQQQYSYGYPPGNYQGGYVNQPYQTGQYVAQSQNQGQYQNFQQGNQYQNQGQFQNQGNQFQNQGQYQNQIQNGQGSQAQIQNQFQNQNGQGQYQNQNQNQQSNLNFQPISANPPNYQNQQGNYVPQNTGTSGNYVTNQQTSVVQNQQGNYIGQSHFVGQNQPQGQVTQTTFGGQNQFSNFQGQTGNQVSGAGNTGANGAFAGHNPGVPGPTCVCQAWTKPLNDVPSQRNEETTTEVSA